MDFLEHPAVVDVVVLSTVLDEVRNQSQAAYARLRALVASPSKRFFVFCNEHCRATAVAALPGESPNDRADRAIRSAAAFYAAVVPGVRVILVTADAASRGAAAAEGIAVRSVGEHAASLAATSLDLADVVARAGDAGGGADVDGDAPEGGGKRTKREAVYAEHLPAASVAAGLAAGSLHQGALRVSRFNAFEAFVGCEAMGVDALVSGRDDMNRAVDGDIVAIQLLPKAEWKRVSPRLPTGGGGGGEAAAAAVEGGGGGGGGGGDGEEEDEAPGAALLQVAPGEHYGGEAAVGSGGEGPRPTARVVSILRRSWRPRGYAGSLEPPREGSADAARVAAGAPARLLFVPVERRFPKVRVSTRQAASLLPMRIVVAIDGWEASSRYPDGHYVRCLGPAGDRDTETEVLILENDVDTRPFSEAVHACVPPLPWCVPPDWQAAEPGREDLRALRVCSVDPPGCKDIDDALHCRPSPDGAGWEVGVHIADVTHFLRFGSAMDSAAAARATSTYLVQRRIDMLPKPLTEDICSLRGGVERFAFSVIWTMNDDASIRSVRFTKSLIRSSAALSYGDAQARMDDGRDGSGLTVDLRQLARLAARLRAGRVAAGALTLASPEVKFVLDASSLDPLDVGMYEVKEANRMVEEFMLLANTSVAARILASFPAAALLRRHPTPTGRMLEPLMAAAGAAGVALDPSSSRTLGASLDAATRPADAYFNKLLRILATRCMTQAVYFVAAEKGAEEHAHYGLAAPLYTHFTSPIRRYADVVVHRLLAAAEGIEPLPDGASDVAALSAIAANLNARHRGAQQAGRASVELHTLLFFRGRAVVADARVTRCRANGLVVFVPKYGIEGPLFFDKDGGDGVLSGDGTRVAVGGRAFTLFDRLAVRISVEQSPIAKREKLVLALAELSQIADAEVARP